jgi:hypothetical protein
MAAPRPAEAESSASAALRHALDGAASDLLRLQAQDFAPRGLVLVVGRAQFPLVVTVSPTIVGPTHAASLTPYTMRFEYFGQ